MNIEDKIASLVIDDFYRHIQKIKVNENQLLVISDLSFPVLELIYKRLVSEANDEFIVKGYSLQVILKDGNEIIPYLINEKDPSGKRSQAFAGKLRNSMEPSESVVRWLVIIGEPTEVEIDTFTSTGVWLIHNLKANESYFDKLFNRYIESAEVHANLRSKVKDVRNALYPNPLGEQQLHDVLKYIENVKVDGNNETAMSKRLVDLGLLPSGSEDSIKPHNLKRNQKFCKDLAEQLDKLEDIDYWIEENVLEEERENFRQLIRNNRNESSEAIHNIAGKVQLEKVINLDQPDESPIYFEKLAGVTFTEGVSSFITGNSRVREITEKTIKIKYNFTRIPNAHTEQVALTINEGECYTLSGFDNKEGEATVDLEALNIIASMEEPRVYKWTIGFLDPEKPNKIRKNQRGNKIYQYEFYMYPNFVKRTWNVVEINEGFAFRNKQCIFNWEEQLTITAVGLFDDLEAELHLDIEDTYGDLDEDADTKQEDTKQTNLTLSTQSGQIIIGPSELKQIRKHVFSNNTSNSEEVSVEVIISDRVGHTFILNFFVGAESELSSIPVNSVQEGIIRFLHEDNEAALKRDRIIENLPYPFKIKMLGGGSNQIRFRIYQDEVEEAHSSIYCIQYPSLLRRIEQEFLNNPLNPFPRKFQQSNGEIINQTNSNWDGTFNEEMCQALDCFLEKRQRLFKAIMLDQGSKGLIVVDLLPYEEWIDEYVQDFHSLLEIIAGDKVMEHYTNILMIDTVFTHAEQSILLAPTHPLKIKAALLLQKHLAHVVEEGSQVEEFSYTLGNIQQWNHKQVPPFFKLKNIYYKALPNPYMYWGFYQIAGEQSLMIENDELLSLFVYSSSKNENKIPSVTKAIENRIDVFLQSYPFLEQKQLPISINCFLSKESDAVIKAVYQLAKRKERVSWKVNFIIPDSRDALTYKETLKRKIVQFQEEVTAVEEQAYISQSIDYSIQIINLDRCEVEDIPYAHISLLSNLFETTITPHAINSFTPAVLHDNLTVVPKTYFAYEENSFYTGVVVLNSEDVLEKTIAKFMSVIACHDLPYQDGIALFSRTNLQPKEMEKIDKIVERSIWVCFLEKEIGVEKFDTTTSQNHNYYLVDYLNKYSSNINGYDLLTITCNRTEIQSLIKNHLIREKYNLERRNEIADDLLKAINCLSGRWALRLIGGEISEVSGLIGSLQVFMFYKNILRMFDPVFNEDHNVLSVLIPLDEYMGVSPRKTDGWFEENKEENYKACSDDFLFVRVEEQNNDLTISCKVIEVKFSKDKTNGQVISKAKEQIYNTVKILADRFLSQKFNRIFKQTEFAELLYFHVMKFMRNDVYGSEQSIKNKVTSLMRRVYGLILANRYDMTFSYQEEDKTLFGEVIAVSPVVRHTEGYELLHSEGRKIVFLYDSIIRAIYDHEEMNSERFNRLRKIWHSYVGQKKSTYDDTLTHHVTDDAQSQTINQGGIVAHTENSDQRNEDNNDQEQEPISYQLETTQNTSTIATEDQKNQDFSKEADQHTISTLWIGNDTNGLEVRIPSQVMMKHVAVLGSTGSGKTRFAKAFIEEITRLGVPSLIIDPQGDIARLIESANRTGLEAKGFYDKAEVRIFTPASNKGIQFSFNPIQMPRKDILAKLSDSYEKEEYLTTVFDSIASNIVSVLSKQDNQIHAFLYMILDKLFKVGETEVTIEALAEYIYRNQHFPLEMSDDQIEMYISKASKQNLVRELKGLTIGTNRSLFSLGFKFDIDRLMQPVTSGKVPINIVYLNSLDTDQKKQFCVSVICNELYKWMLRNPSSQLQLAFYIDEVGPYMPPQNIKKPASKDILMRLYKESRKYGIGCIFCTQNPGDVDSKILNNANTWCIGKIIPKHFESIKKLIDDSGSKQVPGISEVSNFESGEFLVLSSEAFNRGNFKRTIVRDLYTMHGSPYTLEELEEITPKKQREFFLDF